MNYTIMEPKMARFTDEKIIVKDYHYFKGNDHDWNKPAMVSNKIYKFYKKNEETKMPEIEKMKDQEYSDKRDLERQRQEWLLGRKAESKLRLCDRAKERSLVDLRNYQKPQSEDQTQVYTTTLTSTLPSVDVQDVVAKKANVSKHMRSKDNLWAYLHMADKKFVDTVVRPVILRGEENAINTIKSKIEKEKTELLEIQNKKTHFHDNMHEKLVRKHKENIEFGKKLGLFVPGSVVSSPKPIVEKRDSILDSNYLRSSQLAESIVENKSSHSANNVSSLEIKFLSQGRSIPMTDSHLVHMPDAGSIRAYSMNSKNIGTLKSPENILEKRNSNLKRLSLPKSKGVPEFNPDSHDLKGLLVKQVDENAFMRGNYFHEKLANSSQVFNDILIDKKEKKSNRTMTKRTSNVTQCSEDAYTESNFGYSSIRKTPNEDNTYKTSLPLDKIDKTANNDRFKEFNDEIATFERNLSVMIDFGYSKSSLEEAKKSIIREQQKSVTNRK